MEREKIDKKEESYIPPNNIGSITITPVPSQVNQKEKKISDKLYKTSITDKPSSVQKTTIVQSSSVQKATALDNKSVSQKSTDTKPNLIRVKSPAALNESVKTKKPEKPSPDKTQPNPKDKRVDTPLQIETNFHPTKKEPSPKNKDNSPRSKESVTQKQIESLRVKENNIPRPTLVPVHHSPTFAKPDKRPDVKKKEMEFKKKEVEVKKKEIEIKKKKEIMIVSDLDPLSDQEPVAVDDSSSDVEVIEIDRSELSEVPLKDNKVPKKVEEEDNDIDVLMRNIREMEVSHILTNSRSFK